MILLLLAAQVPGVSDMLANGWTPAAAAGVLLLAVMALAKYLHGALKAAVANRDKQLVDAKKAARNRESALLALIGQQTEAVASLADHVRHLTEMMDRDLPR